MALGDYNFIGLTVSYLNSFRIFTIGFVDDIFCMGSCCHCSLGFIRDSRNITDLFAFKMLQYNFLIGSNLETSLLLRLF